MYYYFFNDILFLCLLSVFILKKKKRILYWYFVLIIGMFFVCSFEIYEFDFFLFSRKIWMLVMFLVFFIILLFL